MKKNILICFNLMIIKYIYFSKTFMFSHSTLKEEFKTLFIIVPHKLTSDVHAIYA